MKLYLYPFFSEEDTRGDGGVRRVVEAQRAHLAEFDVELVETPEEADVLAAHIAAPGDFFTRYADKPLVAHNHGFYWAGFDWLGDWAERDNALVMRLVKAADAVTAPSEWVANIIRRHSNRDVRAVYHGVELPETVGPAGDYVLWNKTRVDPICDPEPLREAAQRLPDVRFRSTFWTNERADIEGVAWPANVEITGRLGYEAALAEVRHAAIYLCTARETFGIGTLEAMAAGVPIVGFDWGGQSEIIRDSADGGILVRPNDFDALANAITLALNERPYLSAAARARAEGFTWREAARQYAEIYEDVLARRKDRPKVSVIVTAYNLEAYLESTLASVQMQTMDDWECIVVDDASPDRCGEIALRWAARDPRFKVIQNETNQYLAESRNIGIRAARGRYIFPLDADDMITPRTLEVLSSFLDRDRQVHVAYGNVLFVEPDGVTPTVYQRNRDNPGHSGWPVEFDLNNFFARPGQPLPYASMFRREAWELTGGYRRRVRSSEDCDFWMRLASYGFTPRMVTQIDTLIYRNRPGSMSQTTGWADAENKQWFTWTKERLIMPAAATSPVLLDVTALDPPVVSVITAVGPDHAHLVKDAVDSVDAQTYRMFEHIVVNDTGLPLPELPAWVRVIDARAGEWYETQEHEGQVIVGRPAGVVEARNKGFEASRGRFVVFLDADDYLLPMALDMLLQAARQAGGNDVIYPDFWENSPADPDSFTIFELPDYTCDYVLHKALHAVTALYPRDALVSVAGPNGLFDPMPWEDWDLQLKLATSGVCSRRLAYPVWVYRKETGNRREDRFARRDAGKADMLARWKDYIEGRLEMPCVSCGQRTSTAATFPAPAAGNFAKPSSVPTDAMLLEDTTLHAGGRRTLRGRVTGVQYHFQQGQPRWVDARDARGEGSRPGLLALVGMVRRDPGESVVEAGPPEMTLRAPGPPRGGAAGPALEAPPTPVIEDLPPENEGAPPEQGVPPEPEPETPPAPTAATLVAPSAEESIPARSNASPVASIASGPVDPDDDLARARAAAAGATLATPLGVAQEPSPAPTASEAESTPPPRQTEAPVAEAGQSQPAAAGEGPTASASTTPAQPSQPRRRSTRGRKKNNAAKKS